jgi:hypothetical protein
VIRNQVRLRADIFPWRRIHSETETGIDGRSVEIATTHKTVVVTSQGIGAGAVKAFLARGYSVVGTSRNATKSKELSASDHLALIDGNIGQFETAQKVTAMGPLGLEYLSVKDDPRNNCQIEGSR